MDAPRKTEPATELTFRLKQANFLAHCSYAVSGLAVALFALAVTLVFRDLKLTLMALAGFAIYIIAACKRYQQYAWKVTLDERGITFYYFPGRRFVPWAEVAGIERADIGLTFKITSRFGKIYQIESSIDTPEQFVAAVRQRVQGVAMVQAQEFRIGSGHLAFLAGMLLVAKIGIPLLIAAVVYELTRAGSEGVNSLVLAYSLPGIVTLTVLACVAGCLAKYVALTGSGLHIQTLLGDTELKWHEIDSVSRNNAGSLVVRRGWRRFILHSGMSNFDDLYQVVLAEPSLKRIGFGAQS